MDASRIGGPPPHGQSAPSGDPVRRKRGVWLQVFVGGGRGRGRRDCQTLHSKHSYHPGSVKLSAGIH